MTANQFNMERKLVLLTRGIHANDGIKLAEGFSDRLAIYKTETDSEIHYEIYTQKANERLADRIGKFYRSWDKETKVKIIPDNGRIFCLFLDPLRLNLNTIKLKI